MSSAGAICCVRRNESEELMRRIPMERRDREPRSTGRRSFYPAGARPRLLIMESLKGFENANQSGLGAHPTWYLS
jgi:hypothetical protein